MLLAWYAEYADQAETAAETIAINVSRFGFPNMKFQSFPLSDDFGESEGAGTDAGVGVGIGFTDDADVGIGAGAGALADVGNAVGLVGPGGGELLGPCDGGVPEVMNVVSHFDKATISQTGRSRLRAQKAVA